MRAGITIALLLGVFIFNCCQKKFESPSDNSLNIPIPDFSAKIDGVAFKGSLFGAAIRTDSIISIAAKSYDGKMLVFTLKDSGAHVYSLDIKSTINVGGYIDIVGLAFTSNGGMNSDESGGNLVITSIDTIRRLISGTFTFRGFRQTDRRQKIITDGIFKNISY